MATDRPPHRRLLQRLAALRLRVLEQLHLRVRPTSYKSQATSYKLQVTSYKLQATSYRCAASEVAALRRVVHREQYLWEGEAGHEAVRPLIHVEAAVQVTKLQVTSYKLQATGYKLNRRR